MGNLLVKILQSLFRLYHVYVVPAFAISKVNQMAIPYMLILATLERLVWVTNELYAFLFLSYAIWMNVDN